MSTIASIVVIVAAVLVVWQCWHYRPRPLKAQLGYVGGQIGGLKAYGDPWSSLGPNSKTYAAITGGITIPAYYKRQAIRLSIDTAVSTAVVYGLLNPGTGTGQNGTASATNFHFALSPNQPPLELEYTGPIQLVAGSGTIQVGAIES